AAHARGRRRGDSTPRPAMSTRRARLGQLVARWRPALAVASEARPRAAARPASDRPRRLAFTGRPTVRLLGALALVAYVPLLLTQRGWVSADTKTYLYLDRKSTRLNSSHVKISYAVFCLKN